MLKIYLILSYRNLLKQKGYTLINVLGLSIGLAACLLIILYVQFELSFDRFNIHSDRIYRANIEIKFGNNDLDLAECNPVYGEVARLDIPAIEDFARINWYGDLLIKKGNDVIREGNVGQCDNSLFSIFSFPLLAGDVNHLLDEPKSIVLTESIAKKYFNAINIIGQTLTINNNESRKVTGVIKDLPSNSHIRFKIFMSLIDDPNANEKNWSGNQNYNTYLLLKEGADPHQAEIELNKMVDRNLGPELQNLIGKSLSEFNAQGDYFKTGLISLKDIHLHSNKIGELYGGGNIQYVYIFTAIAFFILIIACVNFMNLATARSSKRSREVGVRKVLGSLKSSLVSQFLTEAILTALAAMLISYIIARISLQSFNRLADTDIGSNVLYSPTLLVSLLLVSCLVGFLAGLYPAFYLSAFQPVTVLKGSMQSGNKKTFLRNSLVVFQFIASCILISGTIIIYQQLRFVRNRDLGYNRTHMLVIKGTDNLGKNIESFRDDLMKISGIQNVTISGYLPTNYSRGNTSFFPTTTLDTKEAISLQEWSIDENYIPTLHMKLVQGRNFSKDMGTDSSAIIINEAAAKFIGGQNILNKKFYNIKNDLTKELSEYHVIGIVQDFNYSSFKDKVLPLAFRYKLSNWSMTVRLNTPDHHHVIDQIKNKYKALAPAFPFEYSFMDDDFQRFFAGEQKVGKLFTVFASLAIFIACMGLFGLATFIAEQRTKEIGVRKVLGASVSIITTMLSKEFIKLVLLAIVIATPLAYIFMNKWLQTFAYRISLQWWMFALAGLIEVAITIVTVSAQSVKAALANPVKSIRTE